jgi:hypothetical protein
MKLPIQAAPVLRDTFPGLMRPFSSSGQGVLPSANCSGKVGCRCVGGDPNQCQWCCPFGDLCGGTPGTCKFPTGTGL